jgi:hypothetical protein
VVNLYSLRIMLFISNEAAVAPFFLTFEVCIIIFDVQRTVRGQNLSGEMIRAFHIGIFTVGQDDVSL